MAKQWPRTWAGRRIGWGYNDRRDLSQQWWVPAEGSECSFGTALDWMQRSQDEVLDKYKMVYDQGLDRVKFPTDITQEAGPAGFKLELFFQRTQQIFLKQEFTSCIFHWPSLNIVTSANHRSMFWLLPYCHLSPLPAAPPCCRFSALGDASWNTQAHKSPVGHIYIKVETWLETPPLPIF